MRLVALTGSGTSVGKTFVTIALARELQAAGQRVAARKPVQSFSDGEVSDAALLASATGEDEHVVCLPERSFCLPLAPPIAAILLERRAPSIAELATELGVAGPSWPSDTDVGLIELAGGLRSPLARDGDCLDLIDALAPSLVVLVTEAGLGAINAVRLNSSALSGSSTLVYLNRFEASDQVHAENLAWLGREGHLLFTNPEDLAQEVLGSST